VHVLPDTRHSDPGSGMRANGRIRETGSSFRSMRKTVDFRSPWTHIGCVHDDMLNGWVVVRLDPWDFRGPFPTKPIAEQVAAHLNAKRHEYDVKWGERPASRLRDSELAFWKGDANDAKGRAIRSGVHGRSNDRKPKTRTGSRR